MGMLLCYSILDVLKSLYNQTLKRLTMQNTKLATDKFLGCEFTKFRPKIDVTEKQLIDACHKMETEFLEREEGFIHHMLLKGDNGLWADVVFAKTKADAERICSNLPKNSACHEYLGLIQEESVELTFWSRVK